MNRTVSTVIDADGCTGCGECIRVCPSGTLSMQNGKAAVTGSESLRCGHCVAVCPVGAVQVNAIDPGTLHFSSFTLGDRWLPYGKTDPAELARVMASRRSCRNFTQQPVDRALLDDLVRFGLLAPSGTNSQQWTFTILPDRAAVQMCAREVAGFYRMLNRLSGSWILRNALRAVGQRALHRYHRDYRASVVQALDDLDRHGTDLLFHGAPAAILVGSRPGASCPAEDALLATQNMLLGAHALGLGTCLVGFVVEAMRRYPRIHRALGIPSKERIHAVIAVGHPDETWCRLVGRFTHAPRVVHARA